MAWVLLAEDHLVEVEDTAGVSTLRLGDEVPANVAQSPRPGILVGRGAGPGATPAQDQGAFPPTMSEMAELIQNVRELGHRLSRGPRFAEHFRDHKHLLERATSQSYPQTPAGEIAFLRDLGWQMSLGALSPVGIATIKRGEPMVYVYQGRLALAALTAIVRPGGEWITLLASGTGMDTSLQYQMRFDRGFPFPFLQQRPTGGFARSFRQ